MTNYDFGVNRKFYYLYKILFTIFCGLALLLILPNLVQAGCSSYKQKVVINEYNYIDSYIELKILDSSVISATDTLKDWKLYLNSKGTADKQVDTGYKKAGSCGTTNDTYMRFNFNSSDIDGTGVVVLKDNIGNEVDYFRLSASPGYPAAPVSTCSAFNYPTDGPVNINSGKKGILRFPDGMGDWIIGQGQGNNSEKSPCGSNDSLLSVTNTASSTTVGVGSAYPFTWTAVVTNGGNNALTNVQIIDELPSGLAFVSCSGSCTGNGTAANPYIVTIPTLAAGASYTWTVTTYATAAGTYTNDIGATANQLYPGYSHGIASVTAVATANNLHHVRLNHAGSGVTCTGSLVTVYRCSSADTNGSCVLYSPNSPLTGSVTAGAVNVPFTILANSSSTTVSVPVTTAQTVTLAVSGLTSTPTNVQTCWNGSSASCSHIYSNAGFIFSDTADGAVATIPTQIAGTTLGTYYLRAVKTNTITKACEAALSAPSSVSLGYQCGNPSICSTGNYLDITPYNGATAQALQTVTAGGTATNFYFDANGNAPFTFNYRDVGLINLYASKTASGTLLSALAGSTNAFVVKPDHFSVSAIKQTAAPQLANLVAASATDAKFVKTGEAFTATVTAMTATNAATPNFGKETPAEGVKLTQNLVLPSGGVIGTLSNASIAGGSFGNGAATVTNLAWDEVGIITLTPSIADADYLGTGNMTGTTSVNIGRFYPDHFTATGTINNRKDLSCTAASAFTYMNEPFELALALSAKNTSGNTTKNYTTASGFAKLDPITAAWLTIGSNNSIGVGAINSGIPLTARLTLDSASPAGTWLAGDGNLTASFSLTRPTTTPPDSTWGAYENLQLGVAPQDADGVSAKTLTLDADNNSSNERVLIGGSKLRFGRLFLQNAYGSELLDLAMPLTAQYWNGTAWVTNSSDSCTDTTLSFAAIGTTNITNKTCVIESGNNSGKGCAAAVVGNYQFLEAGLTGTDSNGIAGFAGNFNLWLKATGAGNSGALDVTATAPGYLQFNWQGTGNSNPTARATFGIYKGNKKQIYFRELY